MAYATGDAATASAFLSALGTFAAVNGWTQDEWDSGNQELHLSKSSLYLVTKGYSSGSYAFVARGATGYASGSSWNAQPGASNYDLLQPFTANSANLFATGTKYHFFTNTSPDLLYAVAVNTAGGTGHLFAGEVTKRGTWTGGQLYGAGDWRYTARTSSFSDDCDVALRCETAGQTWMGKNYTYQVWEQGLATKTSAFSNLSALLPIELNYYNSSSGSKPLGYLTHLRAVDMTNYDPGDELVIGSDTWMIFPRSFRGSYNPMALAVRKVA